MPLRRQCLRDFREEEIVADGFAEKRAEGLILEPRKVIAAHVENPEIEPMDVYFGSEAPNGAEANWVPTVDGSDWFPYFRLYGPQKPFFAKTWKLHDIEKIS